MENRPVIRVKRRRDEEPLDAFVLSKRRKDSSTGEEVSTVLKFAGTTLIKTDAVRQVTRLSNDEARSLAAKQPSKKPADLQADRKHRSRDEHRQQAQQSRFRIVNCSRAVDEEATPEDEATTAAEETAITIVDIEKQTLPTGFNSNSTTLPPATTTTTNMTTSPSQRTAAAATLSHHQAAGEPSGTENYVYDLYVPEVGQPELMISSDEHQFWEQLLSVTAQDDVLFEAYRGSGVAASDYDSEDSNHENDFRNDYPDEDDEEAYGQHNDDDGLGARLGRVRVGSFQGEYDLSSDDDNDEETQYAKQLASGVVSFVHDEDGSRSTADMYGTAYAKYRRRVLKAFKTAAEDDDDDSSDDSRSDLSEDYREEAYDSSDDREVSV